MKSPDKFTLTTAQPILRILATLTQAFDGGVLRFEWQHDF
jgi:hypothetical protein